MNDGSRKKSGYFSFRTMPSTDRRFRAVSQQVGMTCSALANMLVIDFCNRRLLAMPDSRSDHNCRGNPKLDEMFARVVALDWKEQVKEPVGLDEPAEE